jgi:hypothetical protein
MGLEEECASREPAEDPLRVQAAEGDAQLRREPIEVDGPGDEVAGRVRGPRDDLLGEVGEQGTVGMLESGQRLRSPVRLGPAVGLEGEPDGGRPAIGRVEDAHRHVFADGAVGLFVAEDRVDDGSDLRRGEGQGGSAEIHDLALPAQPLHPEGQLRTGRDEQVQFGRSQANEGFDEAPRDRRIVDDVQVVDDEQQVVLEAVLQGVGEERRRRPGPTLRLVLVGDLQRPLDRHGQLRRQVRDPGPEGRGDAGHERAELSIRAIERVPHGRHPGRDVRGKRRLPESRAGDDDRQAALYAFDQLALQLHPRQGPRRVDRWQQLGRAAGHTEACRPALGDPGLGTGDGSAIGLPQGDSRGIVGHASAPAVGRSSISRPAFCRVGHPAVRRGGALSIDRPRYRSVKQTLQSERLY